MNPAVFLIVFASLISLSPQPEAQQISSAFPPTSWPASADANATVHFVALGNFLAPAGARWTSSGMRILSGEDQATAPVTIGGYPGLKVNGLYLNIADTDYSEWSDDAEIDILMQVFGDASLFTTNGQPRNFNFLIGTLPSVDFPVGGRIPITARNNKWNWVLFRIPNTIRPADGQRRVGTIGPNAPPASEAGGVNGGTIRMENVQNLIVRAVAFGQKGAFGEPAQVNVFESPESCPSLPPTNLAWLDLHRNQSNHMRLLNDGDQRIVLQDNVGPTDDKRRAARPQLSFLNFAISDNYLGFPCNEAQTVKICVDYFDDPNLAGRKFGPEVYATDNKGGVAFVPAEQRQTLSGSGKWQRRSWVIQGVNLTGVNTAPLTAGPRMSFDSPIFISRFDLAVLRTGNHPLAGQDPLSDCLSDLDFCDGRYGTFAEMDLGRNHFDGIALGTSGGDQQMIEGIAGPVSDRRRAIRPAQGDGTGGFPHNFLNFAIVDEHLGPSSQPGVRLAICVTYFDDPALAGATFRPEVYASDQNGSVSFAYPPVSMAVALEGNNTWRDAYFELNDVKFNGVNQAPQAAARFLLSDKIYFTRIRYGAIRPCGPEANVNPLEACKPPPVVPQEIILHASTAGTNVTLSWSTNATALSLLSLEELENGTQGKTSRWRTVANSAPALGGLHIVTVPMTSKQQFFRLGYDIDRSTLTSKLMMGYQGWFSAPGDGSAVNAWVHWFKSQTPSAENVTIDFWPDLSELGADELFPTAMTMPDGSPARLYSAYKEKSVVRHFKWMKDHHLDGVFLQRFYSQHSDPAFFDFRNKVASHVRTGAEKYGRTFAMMYDISGQSGLPLFPTLTNDWAYLTGTLGITNSPRYLHHQGKPVLAIWGFGFTDRSGTPAEAQAVINYFKAAGVTILGGVPTFWRTLNNDSKTDQAWAAVYRSYDIISPWSVGRFRDATGANSFRQTQIIPDLAEARAHGREYMPVVFPGFSWGNLNDGPFNEIPRNGGSFYWTQVYNAITAGCTMIYGAMFDEVDEGTAMFKMAPTRAQLPVEATFVPLNIDGKNLPSDWYLKVADQAGRMLRGEIPRRSTLPIAP